MLNQREDAAIRKLEMRLNIGLAIAFVGVNALNAALIGAAISKGIGVAIILALLLFLFSVKYPRQVKRIFIILVAAMLGICLFSTAIGLV